MTVDVFVADEQQEVPLGELDGWVQLARNVLNSRGIKRNAEISLLYVDRAAIATLNEKYLGRTGPTDVLAFPIEDEPVPTGRFPEGGGVGPGQPGTVPELLLLGDVVICPAVAAANATDHGVSVDDELALLLVHGLLHLLGMDHETDAEAEAMERLERKLLDRFYRSAPRQGAGRPSPGGSASDEGARVERASDGGPPVEPAPSGTSPPAGGSVPG